MAFGAGQAHNRPGGGSVLMLTFGTGIGSALFSSGRLYPNTEFGHLIVDGRDVEDLAAASVKTREQLTWESWSERVNMVLSEYERLLSPDLIIFGGGVAENFDKFGHLLHTRAELVPARLRNDAGIIGAALTVLLP
jgi:polyphosphate glucokinase